MGADADAGPVGGGLRIGPRVAVLDEGAQEFVDHVRVTAAVAAALHKGEVICVLNGLREFLDRLGQEMGVIRNLHLFRNLRLGALGHVEDARLAFDEGPFKTLFAAVHINALAVLPGDVVQEAPNVRGDVAVLNLNVAALDGEFVTALLCDVCLLYTSDAADE